MVCISTLVGGGGTAAGRLLGSTGVPAGACQFGGGGGVHVGEAQPQGWLVCVAGDGVGVVGDVGVSEGGCAGGGGGGGGGEDTGELQAPLTLVCGLLLE